MPVARKTPCRGFTLAEVMVAMTALALVIVSTIGALNIGFRVLDDARMNTLASQVLQSEMENLRLKNWDQLKDLPASAPFTVESSLGSSTLTQFTCTRTISTINNSNGQLKLIALSLNWKSRDGRSHDRRYETVMGQHGLNDYFYRKL